MHLAPAGVEPVGSRTRTAFHAFAGPSRVDSIVPNCGSKESASPANFGLIICRSIALLAPDSHRRHVCRCYAGNRWLTQLADFRPRQRPEAPYPLSASCGFLLRRKSTANLCAELFAGCHPAPSLLLNLSDDKKTLELVEGFDPPTRCLQSSRSTN